MILAGVLLTRHGRIDADHGRGRANARVGAVTDQAAGARELGHFENGQLGGGHDRVFFVIYREDGRGGQRLTAR